MIIQIWGGPRDGEVLNVSDSIARSGYMMVPKETVMEFSNDPVTKPVSVEVERWNIVKMCTRTGAIELRLVESGMWTRLNK